MNSNGTSDRSGEARVLNYATPVARYARGSFTLQAAGGALFFTLFTAASSNLVIHGNSINWWKAAAVAIVELLILLGAAALMNRHGRRGFAWGLLIGFCIFFILVPIALILFTFVGV